MSASASEGSASPAVDARVTAALTELGFSQYEAKTYTGLIGREPMTGYAIAKETLVPQPKVYETLGRLVERGMIVEIDLIWMTILHGTNDLIPEIILPPFNPDLAQGDAWRGNMGWGIIVAIGCQQMAQSVS